jgi:hypothetical protein
MPTYNANPRRRGVATNAFISYDQTSTTTGLTFDDHFESTFNDLSWTITTATTATATVSYYDMTRYEWWNYDLTVDDPVYVMERKLVQHRRRRQRQQDVVNSPAEEAIRFARQQAEVLALQQEMERRMEQIRQQQKQLDEEYKAVEQRALLLLRECLSPSQLEEFDKHGRIPVYTKIGNLYIINKGRSGNVVLKNGRGTDIERLCIHPSDAVPDYDTMLAQKLMLEDNEANFRKVANITRL